MINKRGKKAQTVFGMSFGVIFSILLIIFFVVVAFIAIRAFLGVQKCAKIGIFIEDFKTEINKAWNSQSSSFEFSGALPSNLDYVCFGNFSNSLKGDYVDIGEDLSIYQYTESNLFFYPRENACDMPYHTIEHLDIGKITALENPYCISIEGGGISVQIEKGFDDALVSLKS